MQGTDPIPLDNFFRRSTVDQEMDSSIPSPLSGFKEEILTIVKEFEDRMTKKYSSYNEEMEMKMKSYEVQVQELSGKLSEMTKSQSHDKLKLEKIDDLLLFQRKSNDQLTSHEIRINNNTKELTNACYKYDKLYLENLILPGVIGDCCKFKNLREYLDHNLTQVSLLLNFKDKHTLDLKSYKERLEIIIKQFNSQIDGFSKDAIAYTNKSIQECEDNYKEMNNDLVARINEMRMENSKYAVQLKNQANELAIEWDKIVNIQAEIDKKLEESVKEMKALNQSTVDSFGEVHSEFSRIKRKFNDISEFIKDVRFRRNLRVDVKKAELKNLSKKIKFDGKKDMIEDENIKPGGDAKDIEIESYVKRYINGECDINQKKYKEKEKDADYTNLASPNVNKEKDDDDVSIGENDKVIQELAEEVEGSQLGFERTHSEVIEPKIYKTNRSESESQKQSNEGFNSTPSLEIKRRKTVSVSTNISKSLKYGNNSSCNDSFKKEYDKKISKHERKILEIEQFTKKKLQELATQIKFFIPINFNPYIPQSHRNEKMQITAINQTITGEGEITTGKMPFENPMIFTNPKTVNLNFVEPPSIPRNKSNTINENNNYQLMSNFQKFPNKRILQKPPRSQGKIQVNANGEDKKSFVAQFENRQSEEIMENNLPEYKIKKKVEKQRIRDTDEAEIFKPTNYIHLSKVMTNIPKFSSNDDSVISKQLSTNLLKPLKQRLESLDLAESNNLQIP